MRHRRESRGIIPLARGLGDVPPDRQPIREGGRVRHPPALGSCSNWGCPKSSQTLRRKESCLARHTSACGALPIASGLRLRPQRESLLDDRCFHMHYPPCGRNPDCIGTSKQRLRVHVDFGSATLSCELMGCRGEAPPGFRVSLENLRGRVGGTKQASRTAFHYGAEMHNRLGRITHPYGSIVVSYADMIPM